MGDQSDPKRWMLVFQDGHFTWHRTDRTCSAGPGHPLRYEKKPSGPEEVCPECKARDERS